MRRNRHPQKSDKVPTIEGGGPVSEGPVDPVALVAKVRELARLGEGGAITGNFGRGTVQVSQRDSVKRKSAESC